MVTIHVMVNAKLLNMFCYSVSSSEMSEFVSSFGCEKSELLEKMCQSLGKAFWTKC